MIIILQGEQTVDSVNKQPSLNGSELLEAIELMLGAALRSELKAT